MAGEVDEQGDVAVGEHRDRALAAQRLEARADVRPRVQAMPGRHELASRRAGELDAAL